MTTTGNITLRISEEIRERHPHAVAKAIVVENLRDAIRNLKVPSLEELSAGLRSADLHLEDLGSNSIIRAWRDAIGQCGLKPSKYRSSLEALVRRVLRGEPISTSLPAVNLYCALSVEHLTPLGAYDLDRIPAELIELRLARPESDRFNPLGAKPEDMALTNALTIYAAGDTVLCYAFNHRDSQDTCLQESTDRAIFVGESLDPAKTGALAEALRALTDRLTEAGALVTATFSTD